MYIVQIIVHVNDGREYHQLDMDSHASYLVDRPFIYFIIPAHGTKLKESRETFKKTTLESSEP